MEPALAFAPVDVNAFGKVAGMPDDFQTRVFRIIV
jgi:hypothetical protein